jgi:DegV family protein with EDD domain
MTRHAGIVCESTACLPPGAAGELDISVIPIPFTVADRTYHDGIDISPAEVYRAMRQSHQQPKTSPPSPGAYLEAWKQAAVGGAAVSITVNSRISTLQRSARVALDMAPTALPGMTVRVVDSLSAAMGQGFVVLAAARAAASGQAVDEIVEVADRISRKVIMIVTLETLEWVTRASHLPEVAAFVSALLPIRPVFQIAGGNLHLVARARQRRRAIEQVLTRMAQAVGAGARPHVAVQHAGAAEEAAALEAQIGQRFSCEELFTTEFTPVMGGYAGPGLLGVAFYVDA